MVGERDLHPTASVSDAPTLPRAQRKGERFDFQLSPCSRYPEHEARVFASQWVPVLLAPYATALHSADN